MKNKLKKFSLIIVIIAINLVSCSRPSAQDNGGDAPLESTSRLASLLGSSLDSPFPMVTAAREFRFPQDHGPHPEYRNEWWYVTGNLDADGGERFGYELTVFRFALAPTPIASTSAWRSEQIYMAHFALTDVTESQFYVDERLSRGTLGLAGASAEPFRVWLDDWQLSEREGAWSLEAKSAAVDLALTLRPLKPPVLNGSGGLSRKSELAGNASYYYSMTRLETRGRLQVGERVHAVDGLSWLDREWGSSALSADQQGWDWFALQLADHSELMFYQLRRRDGTLDINSAGTYVGPDGSSMALRHEDVEIDVLDYWDSPLGGRYPSRWDVRVPKLELSLRVEPVLAAQEMRTTVRYWEGAVDVVGRRADRRLAGRGYVELTGYATHRAAGDPAGR